MSAKYPPGVQQRLAVGLAFLLLALMHCLDFLQIQRTGLASLIVLEALVITAPFVAGVFAQYLKQAVLFLFVLIIGKLAFDGFIFVLQLELFYSEIPELLSEWLPIALLRLVLPVFFAMLGSVSYLAFTRLFKKTLNG